MRSAAHGSNSSKNVATSCLDADVFSRRSPRAAAINAGFSATHLCKAHAKGALQNSNLPSAAEPCC